MMPWLVRQRKMLLPVICFWVLIVGVSLPCIYHEHYAAPIAAVKILLLVEGLRYLTAPLGRRLRLRRIPLFVAAAVLLLVVRHGLQFSFSQGLSSLSVSENLSSFSVSQNLSSLDYGLWSLSVQRPRILAELNKLPGKQLVIVRYASTHDPHLEWVYNAANIDQSKVIWARELDPASNTRLLQYFHDRRAWLLKPDERLPRLEPYSAATMLR